MRDLELYIHIPFCVRKCAYCDFLSAPASDEVKADYVDALIKEIEGWAKENQDKEYRITSIFFGGGTPSILPAGQIERIMAAVKDSFSIAPDAENTIEANPGTVDREKLQIYRRAGINRISFGLQSADNKELALLGRIHTWEEFLKSYEEARKAGFDNINIDLMSALPGQSVESYRETLRKVLDLNPEHISAYSLIIEDGTPFYDAYSNHPELLPDEDSERQMYYDTEEILNRHGYLRYEISNYAKPGFACRHNLGYWERKEYKGFGLGAASLIGDTRTSNETDLMAYLEGSFAGSEAVLSAQEKREEFFFLGLRKMEGICPGEYRTFYNERIDRLIEDGLLEETENRLRLTARGIDVSNYVLAQFLDD